MTELGNEGASPGARRPLLIFGAVAAVVVLFGAAISALALIGNSHPGCQATASPQNVAIAPYEPSAAFSVQFVAKLPKDSVPGSPGASPYAFTIHGARLTDLPLTYLQNKFVVSPARTDICGWTVTRDHNFVLFINPALKSGKYTLRLDMPDSRVAIDYFDVK
ncbi:MAG: hypothetical protein ACYDAY_11905 [Candidatus Dormibacteria bacterium]